MEATPAARSYRDDPEWQAAQADYIAEHGDPDETAAVRVKAAFRMHVIEKAAEARA